MKPYTAVVHEPASIHPFILKASSKIQLNIIIRLRINALFHEFKHSFIQSLLIISGLLLLATLASLLWLYSIILITVSMTSYTIIAPYRLNPLARTYWRWRCLKMWEIELARRCAVEEQDWYQ